MTTQFNPENKHSLTYGESLSPAMEITDQEDADQYSEAYVEYLRGCLSENPRDDGMTAEQLAKSNLGYFAGYYDSETQSRVNKLFKCCHPIFGS